MFQTDRFEARLIQRMYLTDAYGEAGFRDLLVLMVGRACGTMGPGLLFSEENEIARVGASVWIWDLCSAIGGITFSRSIIAIGSKDQNRHITAANRMIAILCLGNNITREEVGLGRDV